MLPLITTVPLLLSGKYEQKLLPVFPAVAITKPLTQAIKHYCAEWTPVDSPTLSVWGFLIHLLNVHVKINNENIISFFAK